MVMMMMITPFANFEACGIVLVGEKIIILLE